LGYISHICPETSRGQIYTKFGFGVAVADVVGLFVGVKNQWFP